MDYNEQHGGYMPCDHHCDHREEDALRAYFAQRLTEGYDTAPSEVALRLLPPSVQPSR